MKITKLEAAIRQLKEVIMMHFERKDPVAIHTVASAASMILFNLAEYKKVESIIRNSTLLKPEMKKEWNAALNKPQNFFKHADKDPDGEIEFDPYLTELFILESCLTAEQLMGKPMIETTIYIIWFALKYPTKIFKDSYIELIKANGITKEDVEDYDLMIKAIKNANGHT